jgi:DNA polymerase IV
VLKLKDRNFVLRSRHARLAAPALAPETLFAAARDLLAREVDGTAFRLIGVGAQPLAAAAAADHGDLADRESPRRAARWQAIEALRRRFGDAVVVQGRSLPTPGDGNR